MKMIVLKIFIHQMKIQKNNLKEKLNKIIKIKILKNKNFEVIIIL